MKVVRTISDEEAKVKYKGKTLTLKETDSQERKIEVNTLFKENKITLLYCNVVNDTTNWVYEYIK